MKFKAVLPILGFENIKEYDLEKIDDNFFRLKSEKATFTLLNPFLLRKDYDFEISEKDRQALNLKEGTDFSVLNILIINTPFVNSTVNFAAPLIFNADDKIMGQVILDKYGYGLTEPVKNFVGEEIGEKK